MGKTTRQDRRLSVVASPNPDITENRIAAFEMLEKYNKPVFRHTEEDIHRFWQDFDMEVEKEDAWDYVNYNYVKLCEMYPFEVTEWFMEFFRYMPECLWYHYDDAGDVDWCCFFSLLYPLPGNLGISYCEMIKKLNVSQNRQVKRQILDEIWNDPDLKHKILRGDLVPSIYIYYTPYQTLRKAIIERQEKYNRALKKEKKEQISGHTPPPWLKEAHKLRQEGKTPEEILKILV